MKPNDKALSAEEYNTFACFSEDELFVARQLSLGHEMPKIETQLQVKMFRASKQKSARELFSDICNRLDLYGLGSEKAMLRAIVKSYNKFADVCHTGARFAAPQGTQIAKHNATQQPGANARLEVPDDIIAYYKLDLDALAEKVYSLTVRQKATLRHLRTGDETGRQIAERMSVRRSAVSGNFNDVYKRLLIHHIGGWKHKRIIARLAYLRWSEKEDMAGKPHSPDSLDST